MNMLMVEDRFPQVYLGPQNRSNGAPSAVPVPLRCMKQIRGTHTNILSYLHGPGRVAVAPKEQDDCFDGKRNFTRSDAFIISWKAPWAM
jgi:hypothetical protein